MPRHDGRAPDELRPVRIERGFIRNSPGSVLYRAGGTTVVVTAHVSDTVPPFLEGKGRGWLTAEYAMLPGST
ncbi:MAG: ribonuclease PH, partial [Planctomycetaceae bacterium]|nr:ribonuclease PH [Planctomycetaceae bacterium]